jgi:UDP-glucose 4-epimerase
MKCLVTGGAGFIGSNLVDELIRQGYEVVVADNLSTGKKEYLNPQAKYEPVDVTADITGGHGRDRNSGWPSDNWNIFEGVDVVFHLAAAAEVDPSIKDPKKFNKVNIDGTLTMLKAAADNGVKRFVYSSSSSCYGDPERVPTDESCSIDPMSPYALQKYVGEQYCSLFSKIYGLETVSLRYFNVFGNRQRDKGAYALATGIFLRQHRNNEPLTVTGDGEQKRDFICVDDIVNANIQAAKSDKVGNGESINIGSGNPISINQIANSISDNIKYIEERIEPKITCADITLAKELLDWSPTISFNDWLKKEEIL